MAKSKESTTERLKQFAFEITYKSDQSTEFQVLIWIAEKLLVVSPAIIRIFLNTKWSIVASIFQYIRSFATYGSYASFMQFSCILFCIFQSAAILTLYQLFCSKKDNSNLNSRLNTKKGIVPLLGHAYTLLYRIGLPLVTTSFTYLILLLIKDGKLTFTDYDQISETIMEALSWQHILTLVLNSICLVESIILAFCYIFFFTDTSLIKVSIWSTRSWQEPTIELITKILISIVFMVDASSEQSSVTSLLGSFLYGLLIAVHFYKTISAYFWADLAELFYESFAFLLQVYLLISFFWAEAAKKYDNTIIFIPLSLLACAHRGLRLMTISYAKLKTDEDAINALNILIMLCISKEPDVGVKLSSMMCKHSKKCKEATCECNKLLSTASESRSDIVTENYAVYSSCHDIPAKMRTSWRLKAMKILMTDIHKKFNKSDDISILVAQASYMYLGNHYYSLVLLSNIQSKDPPGLIMLQIYYLRRIISYGMQNHCDDLNHLLDSLEYQDLYKNFLKDADDIAELTVKFWATLLSESPDTSILNSIGINLFNSRRKLMATINEINRICSNNIEFLIKYGIYSKIILHDAYSSSASFNRIIRSIDRVCQGHSAEASFSILRSDVKNMMVVISLETKDYMLIVEANSEAENMLKCTRNELIGKSVANIMPPNIAQSHQQYMQKYFRDMETKNINTKRLRFIKNKDGFYLPCEIMKSIVPKLTCGFQGALFAHIDKKISLYVSSKKETTLKETGAIICNEHLKITGFSNEVSKLLDINDRVLTEVTDKCGLDSFFPEVTREKEMNMLMDPKGCVMKSHVKNFFAEGENDEKPTEEQEGEILIWARIVKEKCGDNDTNVLFLFSPIPKSQVHKYVSKNSDTNIIENEENQFYYSIDMGGLEAKKRKSAKLQEIKENAAKSPSEDINEHKDTIEEGTENSLTHSDISGNQSSVKTGSTRQPTQFAKELLDRAFSEETPSSIKKLAAAIIVLFFIVMVLISTFYSLTLVLVVDAVLTKEETEHLEERFRLIEYYESRFRHSMILFNQAKILNGTRSGTAKTSYDMAWLRVDDSLTKITAANVNTRIQFAASNLDYDSEYIVVTDQGSSYPITFSHAMIKLINYSMTLLQATPYSSLVALCHDTTNSYCKESVAAADYITSSTFSPMRLYQDKYSAILRNDIESSSANGEETLYILISCCIAIVFVSIALIFPVFIWVIQDKSYVIAIFADIPDDEIRLIIKEAESFDIRRVKCKNRWILSCQGDEEKFWSKVTKAKKKEKKKRGILQASPIGSLMSQSKLKSKDIPDQSVAPSEQPLRKSMILQNFESNMGLTSLEKKKEKEEKNIKKNEESESRLEESKKEDLDRSMDAKKKLGEELEDSKSEDDPKKEIGLEIEKIKKEEEKKKIEEEILKKCAAKKNILSRLDSKLRNTAIIRLAIVLFVFLVYGGVSLYFNYFFHDFNRSAVNQFYVLLKRDLYMPTVSSLLRRVVTMMDKKFATKNPSNQILAEVLEPETGEMYLQDVIEKMLEIEGQMKEFEKRGNREIYKEYFAANARLNSPKFCDVIDALPYKEPESPQTQGLTGGLNLLITFINSYSVKALRTDYNNATALAALQTDYFFLNYPFLIIQYIFPALDLLVDTFENETVNFFVLARNLALAKASCFSFIFAAVYFFIFIYFLNMLKFEIWQTQSIINMIPDTVLEKNKAVQEQVWKRRGIK